MDLEAETLLMPWFARAMFDKALKPDLLTHNLRPVKFEDGPGNRVTVLVDSVPYEY